MHKTPIIKKRLETLKIQAAQTAHTEKTCTERLTAKTRHRKNMQEAQALLQAVAETVQESVHHKIADIVTRCLKAVFLEPYEFRVLFDQKRGKTEARMLFYRDGQELDPMDAAGGGVVDITAFALRIASILLAEKTCKTLILDEPFKFVSAEYQDAAREILETLAREMEVQIIQVTHIETLKTGAIVPLEQ